MSDSACTRRFKPPPALPRERRCAHTLGIALAASLSIHALVIVAVPAPPREYVRPVPNTLEVALRTEPAEPHPNAVVAERGAPARRQPARAHSLPAKPIEQDKRLSQRTPDAPGKQKKKADLARIGKTGAPRRKHEPVPERPAKARIIAKARMQDTHPRPRPTPPPRTAAAAAAKGPEPLRAPIGRPAPDPTPAVTERERAMRQESAGIAAVPDRDERASVPAASPARVETTPPHLDARYLRNSPPRYPSGARRRGVEGTVTLRVHVRSDGVPASVELEATSGSHSLDQAALDAVREWRFAPARQGGNAVEAWVLVPVVFRLEGTS